MKLESILYNTKYCILLMFFLSSNTGMAQKSDSVNIENNRNRTLQKLGLFCDYIKSIADKNCSLQDRRRMADKAISLFINRGSEFLENNVERKGVTIEILHPDGHREKMLLKNYLMGLANLRYKPVIITGVKVGELQIESLRPFPTDSTLFIESINYNTLLKMESPLIYLIV